MALGTTDIPIEDIQQALGDSSMNAKELILSANINKWSRHKPVHSSVLFCDTMAAQDALLQAANYGLTAGTYSDPLSACAAGYTYIRPGDGSGTSAYRLGDLRKYEHGASAPVLSLADITAMYGYSSVEFQLGLSASSDYVLGLQDLPSIQDYYLTILLTADNWSTVYAVSETVPISQSTGRVTLNDSSYFRHRGTYKIKAVACSVSIGSDPVQVATGILRNASYIPLPFGSVSANDATLKVYTQATALKLSVVPMYDNGAILNVTVTAAFDNLGVHTADVVVSVSGININTGSGYVGYVSSEGKEITIPAGSNSAMWSAAASTFDNLPTVSPGDTAKASAMPPAAWRSVTTYEEFTF